MSPVFRLFIIVLCSTFAVFAAAGDKSFDYDAAVQRLQAKYQTEFNAYKQQKDYSHPAFQWMEFFETKVHQAGFTPNDRVALNALLTAGKGFGGIDYSRQATPEEAATWVACLLEMDPVKDNLQIVQSVVPEQYREAQTKFHIYLTDLGKIASSLDVRQRVQGLQTLRSFPGLSAQQCTTPPQTVCATPIFVDRKGNMAVLTSTDQSGNSYSAAYGGNAGGDPRKKFYEELTEEMAGLFDHPSPENQKNLVLAVAARELKNLQHEMVQSSDPSCHHVRIGKYSGAVTWGSTISRKSGHFALSGVIFLPIEVLGVDEIDVNNETDVPALIGQLAYAHSNHLGTDYTERGAHRLVELRAYLDETNSQQKLIQKPRAFGSDINKLPVRKGTGENHMRYWKQMDTVMKVVLKDRYNRYYKN